MELTYDTRSHLERTSYPACIIRAFVVPILNRLISARALQALVRKSAHGGAAAVDKATSSQAMDTLYDRPQRKIGRGAMRTNITNYLWHHVLSQPAAVRNRLRLVEEAIEAELIRHKNSRTPHVAALTIAGGSARAMHAVLLRLIAVDLLPPVHVQVLDTDAPALELGKLHALKSDTAVNFTWSLGSALEVDRHVLKRSVHIAEMVGLIEYLNDEDVIAVLKKIRACMHQGGLLIITQTAHNSEVPFVRKVGWGAIRYRSHRALLELLRTAGFAEDRIKLRIEPLKIHTVATARM